MVYCQSNLGHCRSVKIALLYSYDLEFECRNPLILHNTYEWKTNKINAQDTVPYTTVNVTETVFEGRTHDRPSSTTIAVSSHHLPVYNFKRPI